MDMKYLPTEKKVAAILRQWKHEAGVTTTVKFGLRGKTLTVCTSQCGFMVGRAGTIINKYRQMFKDYDVEIENIELIEVSRSNI